MESQTTPQPAESVEGTTIHRFLFRWAKARGLDPIVDGDCDNGGYLDAIIDQLGDEIRFVFNRGQGGPDLTFVDVETPDGRSIDVGRWTEIHGRPVLVLSCITTRNGVDLSVRWPE